ncbi:MAG: gluconate 2-dehydrogenase subunit 3 family protein [Candidatus Dormibacteria bacterium]
MAQTGPLPDRLPKVDLTLPDHLPNLRKDRQPPHPSWLPRQRRGVTPQMVGRYPDYDVFDAAPTWDQATLEVICQRMATGRSFRFFTPEEQPTLQALCDRAVAQDEEPRIPVAEMIDEKLAEGRLDGFQYAGMPDDRDTWRLTLAGLDEAAGARFQGNRLALLAEKDQLALVQEFSEGSLSAPSLERLNVKRAWSVCMRMILSAFYAHPWAWNEIGFGGPAYPRGFMRMSQVSTREPFERPGATAEDPVRQVAEGKE